MSQPRTRSQSPPETEVSEEREQSTNQEPSTEERRMSRELQAKLEVLQLHPAQNTKEGESSQMKKRTTRPASAMLRPLSTMPPALRSNSVLGTLVSREVSTKFNQYHVVDYLCIIPQQKMESKIT